ncbi:hypothetical protein AcV7_004855 [Taiwanofungus camphoratus]|nr:hypothetical protein AcV7_004855 [Antrodia cinnamomea]
MKITPSTVLASLSCALSADSFAIILAKYLHPALDALPEDFQKTICSGLLEAQRDCAEIQTLIAKINYERLREELEMETKTLEKHARRASYGTEELGDIMKVVLDKINGWLPILWRTGVEKGIEIPLIHRCFLLCKSILSRVGTVADMRNVHDLKYDIQITDTQETVVYSQHVPTNQALLWAWRELALAALVVHQNDILARAMIYDWQQLKILSDVESNLRPDGDNSGDDGNIYIDAHWTEGMKTAVSPLRTLFVSTRMQAFEKMPSIPLYHSLVRTSPDLRAALLKATRAHIQGNRGSTSPSIPWAVAAEIFCLEKQLADLLQLNDAIPEFGSNPDWSVARRRIATYYGTQSDPDLRAKGLEIVKAGLERETSSGWFEIVRAFPCWSIAWRWLEGQIEEGKLTAQRNPRASAREQARRNNILRKFGGIIKGGPDKHLYERGYGRDMPGVEESDSDYEEEREGRYPDIAGNIRAWIDVLASWSSQDDAIEVLDSITVSNGSCFDVDGVVDILEDIR